MKKKNRLTEIKLTQKSDKLLRKAAKKSGLKPEKVLNLMLKCEVDIAYYAMSKRLKLFKRLKIEPTVEQLLGFKVVADMEFYDLDGALIRRNSSGNLNDLWRWNGGCWIKFDDELRLYWSGCKISEERAVQTLMELSVRTKSVYLTHDQARQKLFN